MINKIKYTGSVLFWCFVALSIHYAFVYFLPYPFTKVNFIFLFIIFYSIIFEENNFFIPLILGFVVELFSSVPFGFVFIPIFFTLLVLNWLRHNIFTHLSFYSILFFGIVSVLFYKLIYNFLIVLFNIFNNYTFHLNYNNALDFIYEIGVSLVVILLMNIIYFLLKNKFKKKKIVYYG